MISYWRDVRLFAARRLGRLLDDLADARVEERGSRALVQAFYRSALDEPAIARKGLTPLKPELDAIEALRTAGAFASLAGASEGPGTLRAPSVRVAPGQNLFSLAIAPDARFPGRYAVHLGQAGLMMPGPDIMPTPASRRFADPIAIMSRACSA